MSGRTVRWLVAAATCVLAAGCTYAGNGGLAAGSGVPAASTTSAASGSSKLNVAEMKAVRPVPAPAGEEYFGVQLDWLADSPASYVSRLGRVPYDFGEFISVPMSAAETAELDQVVAKIAALHSKLFLTAEIPDGLQVITPAVAQSFAELLARYNSEGVGIWVRFGRR